MFEKNFITKWIWNYTECKKNVDNVALVYVVATTLFSNNNTLCMLKVNTKWTVSNKSNTAIATASTTTIHQVQSRTYMNSFCATHIHTHTHTHCPIHQLRCQNSFRLFRQTLRVEIQKISPHIFHFGFRRLHDNALQYAFFIDILRRIYMRRKICFYVTLVTILLHIATLVFAILVIFKHVFTFFVFFFCFGTITDNDTICRIDQRLQSEACHWQTFGLRCHVTLNGHIEAQTSSTGMNQNGMAVANLDNVPVHTVEAGV